MTSSMPADIREREKALDPSRSFIVQAPAGSGKTELLTQRYLKLLSLVQNPEEILAITFTRKAAAEMRNRVVSALNRAGSEPRPDKPHFALTWDLASRALEQDRKLGWNIQDNPTRLKIRTIDSFCHYLTAGLPVLSGMGGDPEITEDADQLYEEAARNTLLELNSESSLGKGLYRILLHLDNDWNKVKDLIKVMLELRQHWLRLIVPAARIRDLKPVLEDCLAWEVRRNLENARQLMSDSLSNDQLATLLECARYAAFNLESSDSQTRVKYLADLESLPGSNLDDLCKWQGIRELLLRKDGQWRKSVDKNLGFPPAGPKKNKAQANSNAANQKNIFLALLTALSEFPRLEKSLARLGSLPETEYIDDSWEVLSSLLLVLKAAVAHLSLVMRSRGRVDYTEVSMAALHALGQPQDPSELLLSLDCRISHILFDEFQDTSINQQQMLAALVSGWTPGDCRTVFAVGDPMQSIYMFRDADVGVFINTRQNGVSDILLEPLYLSANFRSSPAVVDWVNENLPPVFQDTEDHVSGSVIYSRMSAARDMPGLVQLHPLIEKGPEDEAGQIIEIISRTRKEHPDDNIAVLVRYRSHLAEIIKLLRRHNLSFQAVEIEPLWHRQTVMDLLSLTRALLRPGDKLAWLSVLRAPWAGLDLKDMSRLSSPRDQETILEKMSRIQEIDGLSPEGRIRLQKTADILLPAWENRLRRPLHRLVQGIWTALGGPACTGGGQGLEDAEAFLQRLADLEQHQTIEDLQDLERTLKSLYSAPDPESDGRLQIMTIHKAKGLEFDTVILPGLHRIPKPEEKLLLQFMEVPSEERGPASRLLLAPIPPAGEKPHPTYNYIEELKKIRQDNETGRLLYVAVTRAVKRLHLLGSVSVNKKKNSRTLLAVPDRKSLLFQMWDGLEHQFNQAYNPDILDQTDKTVEIRPGSNPLNRLGLDWTMPETLPHSFPGLQAQPRSGAKDSPDEKVVYQWAGDSIRMIGISVHEILALIAEQGLDKWTGMDNQDLAWQAKRSLSLQGMSRNDLVRSAETVVRAIKNTLSDETGRWILSDHSRARCECGLSALQDNEIIRVVIDRTFIDQRGTRWIIDYKTSAHEGGGLDLFLDSEAYRYREQLCRYARVFRLLEDNIVRAGLYFPLLKAWREVSIPE